MIVIEPESCVVFTPYIVYHITIPGCLPLFDANLTREFFLDGRRASGYFEFLTEKIFTNWKRIPGDKSYDSIHDKIERWENRVVGRAGVAFTPSGAVGKNRTFKIEEFDEKLNGLHGYIIGDFRQYPLVRIIGFPISYIITNGIASKSFTIHQIDDLFNQWSFNRGELNEPQEIRPSVIQEIRCLGQILGETNIPQTPNN